MRESGLRAAVYANLNDPRGVGDSSVPSGTAAYRIARLADDFAAGAAGCFLEDQLWPKRCGHMRGKKVIEREQYIQKIKAAVDARDGRDFFIVFAHVEANSGLWAEIKGGRMKELSENALIQKYALGFQKVRTNDKADKVCLPLTFFTKPYFHQCFGPFQMDPFRLLDIRGIRHIKGFG